MHAKLVTLERQFKPSLLIPVNDPRLAKYKVKVWVKRDDLLHPIISGNKWRKLKFILNHALSLQTNTLISMGGAYSNHLHALAYTGKLLQLHTKGFIRGEKPDKLNPTLADLQTWGMQLQFISRSDFRSLRQYRDHRALPGLTEQQYWLPEGGAQALALSGVAQMVSEIDIDYDCICLPCGTGITLAGVANAVPAAVQVLGIAALKSANFLLQDIRAFMAQGRKTGAVDSASGDWTVNFDYTFGGFARTTAELLTFMNEFERCTAIKLEPLYTGKMLFAVYDLITKGYFQAGQRIIAIHTGGLQGNRGLGRCKDN